MEFEKYSGRGLSGLSNLGNTCFLNSAMQVLSHTYELNAFLDKKTYFQKLNKKYESALLIEWDELRELLWKENWIVSPFKFVKIVQKLAEIKGQTLFTGFHQNDLPEFLMFVIDCFHMALAREVNMSIEGTIRNEKDKLAMQCFKKIHEMYKKEYSEIWKLFYGMQLSQLTNSETNETISVTPEPFFIINLPIPENNKSPTLLDCFNLYIEEELMHGDNCVEIETSGQKVSAKKSMSFWNFPDILVVDLKRFNAMNRKNQIMVDFPVENLDLSSYVVGYNHIESSMGGHYTAFVKNANGQWYHYNDSDVSEIGECHLKTPKAYCFFYRKRK
jgi:ubiquitin C-terminal hydrolase